MTANTDYSFLFFKPTLAEVAEAMGDCQISEIFNYSYVSLGTLKTYRQITNVDRAGFNFGANYTVHLVDCCDTVILDITPNVTIQKFTHRDTGFDNAIIEIKNIGVDFYARCLSMKITQTTNPSNVWYSAPFNITENRKDCSDIYYTSPSMIDGIDYETAGVMQAIGLKGLFTKATRETNSEVYLQTTGNNISKSEIRNLAYNFSVEYQHNHGLEAFETLVAHPVVYAVDAMKTTLAIRFNTIIPDSQERLGNTNFFVSSFKAYIDRSDLYDTTQGGITTPFALLQAGLQPFGNVTLAVVSGLTIKGFFNKNMTIGTGVLTVIDKISGTKVAIYNQSDIVMVGLNGFEIPSSVGVITANSDYYIVFTSGLFVSVISENYAVSNDTEWHFEVTTDGDWLTGDWNDLDWFTGV